MYVGIGVGCVSVNVSVRSCVVDVDSVGSSCGIVGSGCGGVVDSGVSGGGSGGYPRMCVSQNTCSQIL